MFGHPIHRHDTLPSTNDEAARLASEGAPEGTLVIAQSQTRGRGRMGRTWESPRGGLWMSIVLRPECDSEALPGLTLVLATALAEALPVEATVRWPNDVYAGDRKLAGILAEARWSGDRMDFCCVGVGINVALPTSDLPPEVRERATSLLDLGIATTPDDVLQAVLPRLEGTCSTFTRDGFEALRPRVEARCSTLGRRVAISRGPGDVLYGEAVALGPQGSLQVDTDAGRVAIWTCEEARILG